MVKKGKKTLQQGIKKGSNSNKDKSKYVKKNQEVIHDGMVNKITPKLAKPTLNLMGNIKSSKTTHKSPSNNKTIGNKKKNPFWATCQK